MRRNTFVFAVLAAALIPAVAGAGNTRLLDTQKTITKINGVPSGGTQSISVTTTSGTQAAAIAGGSTVAVVNDGSTKAYCMAVTSSSGTTTTSAGFPLNADDKVYWVLKSNQTHIACITSSGTTTVRVYVME